MHIFHQNAYQREGICRYNMGFPIPLWKESDQDGACPVHTLKILGTLLCTSHTNGLLCTNICKGYFCVQTISVWHPFNNISSFRQFHQHTFICVIQTCWTISLAYIQQFYIYTFDSLINKLCIIIGNLLPAATIVEVYCIQEQNSWG